MIVLRSMSKINPYMMQPKTGLHNKWRRILHQYILWSLHMNIQLTCRIPLQICDLPGQAVLPTLSQQYRVSQLLQGMYACRRHLSTLELPRIPLMSSIHIG
jgi:hypothetical protein